MRRGLKIGFVLVMIVATSLAAYDFFIPRVDYGDISYFYEETISFNISNNSSFEAYIPQIDTDNPRQNNICPEGFMREFNRQRSPNITASRLDTTNGACIRIQQPVPMDIDQSVVCYFGGSYNIDDGSLSKALRENPPIEMKPSTMNGSECLVFINLSNGERCEGFSMVFGYSELVVGHQNNYIRPSPISPIHHVLSSGWIKIQSDGPLENGWNRLPVLIEMGDGPQLGVQ